MTNSALAVKILTWSCNLQAIPIGCGTRLTLSSLSRRFSGPITMHEAQGSHQDLACTFPLLKITSGTSGAESLSSGIPEPTPAKWFPDPEIVYGRNWRKRIRNIATLGSTGMCYERSRILYSSPFRHLRPLESTGIIFYYYNVKPLIEDRRLTFLYMPDQWIIWGLGLPKIQDIMAYSKTPTVIIIGAGPSGIATAHKLKTELGFNDFLACVE
jgi:hypothetical protein